MNPLTDIVEQNLKRNCTPINNTTTNNSFSVHIQIRKLDLNIPSTDVEELYPLNLEEQNPSTDLQQQNHSTLEQQKKP